MAVRNPFAFLMGRHGPAIRPDLGADIVMVLETRHNRGRYGGPHVGRFYSSTNACSPWASNTLIGNDSIKLA